MPVKLLCRQGLGQCRKDEYSESDLEEALILHLESFLLELGGTFLFAGRHKRPRIGDAWPHLPMQQPMPIFLLSQCID